MGKRLDVEVVKRLYLDEHLSCAKIAARLDTHDETIRKLLERQGIARRGRDDYDHPGQKRKLELTPDELDRLYWYELKTATEIGLIYGVHSATVRNYLKRYGIPRRPAGGQTGSLNAAWVGGRKIDKDGYVLIYCPDHPHARANGNVLEHRLVMEKKLGRYLEPEEVVHHKDTNKQNNHPDNLEVYSSNAEHLRDELTGKVPNWTPEGKAKLLEICRNQKPVEFGPERRERMSQVMKQKWANGEIHRTFSDETRQKMSENAKLRYPRRKKNEKGQFV